MCEIYRAEVRLLLEREEPKPEAYLLYGSGSLTPCSWSPPWMALASHRYVILWPLGQIASQGPTDRLWYVVTAEAGRAFTIPTDTVVVRAPKYKRLDRHVLHLATASPSLFTHSIFTDRRHISAP